MKRVFFICISIVLLLTGCAGGYNEEKAVDLIEKFHYDKENFTESDANDMVGQLEALDDKIFSMMDENKENGTDNITEINDLLLVRFELEQITQQKLAEEYPAVAEKSRQESLRFSKKVNKD